MEIRKIRKIYKCDFGYKGVMMGHFEDSQLQRLLLRLRQTLRRTCTDTNKRYEFHVYAGGLTAEDDEFLAEGFYNGGGRSLSYTKACRVNW